MTEYFDIIGPGKVNEDELQKSPNPFVQEDKEFERFFFEECYPIESDTDQPISNYLSSIGKCIRMQWYTRMGYPDERNMQNGEEREVNTLADWKEVFSLSNAVEDWVTKKLLYGGVYRGKVRVRDFDTKASGETDGIVKWYDDKKITVEPDGTVSVTLVDRKNLNVILEVKASHEWEYNRNYEDATVRGKIQSSWYWQMQSYLYFLPQMPYVIWILVNRNMVPNSKKPPYVIRRIYRHPKIQEIIPLKLKALEDAIKAGKAPKRPHEVVIVNDKVVESRSDWQCSRQYCGYQHQCWFVDIEPKYVPPVDDDE